MSKYIAIFETHPKKNKKGFPENFPKSCREFLTLEDAVNACPNARIMPISEYDSYIKELEQLIIPPKRNWFARLFLGPL